MYKRQDVVDLKYWNILQREGSEVTSIDIIKNPELFNDFAFTGLSNFDFFSSDYIARKMKGHNEYCLLYTSSVFFYLSLRQNYPVALWTTG